MAGETIKSQLRNNYHHKAAYHFLILIMMLGFGASAQITSEKIFPFNLEFDHISRLLLISFEADPDTVYIGFEPQVIPLGDNEEAHLILGWRVDGRVDVYHQSSLSPDPGKYNIAGKGLANMIPCHMDTIEFSMSKTGLRAQYAFADLYGRQISIKITENGHKSHRPFSLLAPVGYSAEQPKSLPLLFLHDFYFVRQKHTDFHVNIAGRSHQPDKLPFPIDGKRMYFTRYCLNPKIATFLPSAEKYRLLPTATQANNGTTYLWDENEKLKGIRWNDGEYEVSLLLKHSMPDLNELVETKQNFSTRFTIAGLASAGSVSGIIDVKPEGERLHLQLKPDRGWKPRPDRLSLRILYRVAGLFRNWPKNYQWDASVFRDAERHFHIQSAWMNQKDKK